MSTPHTLPSLTVSTDGYIRLTLDELQAVALMHLSSGLDGSEAMQSPGATIATDITGFTEWVSQGTPAISIGWDWEMTGQDSQCRLHLLNHPRSNLMLIQNSNRIDVGQRANLALLKEFVNQLLWQDDVIRFLTQQYTR